MLRRLRSVWALPINKQAIRKCGMVNWNEGLRSMPRGKLNWLTLRTTKGCAKSVEMPLKLFALSFCAKLKLNTAHH